MAIITKTSKGGSGSRVVTVTTLGASDTFVYKPGDELHVDNVTVGSLTLTIDGDGSSSISVPGYGSLDVSTGYQLTVAAGEKAMVPLDTISAYLSGTVTVTGGDGAEVYILTA